MSDSFDHVLDALEREEMEQSELTDPAFYGMEARVPQRSYEIANASVARCVATRQPRLVSCKRCGCSGLHWQQTRGGYRLYDENGLSHECEVTANGVDRNKLYAVVDRLDAGELNELKHYCEQRLAKSRRHG